MNPPPPDNSLSFGIELEGVLLYHNTLMKPLLPPTWEPVTIDGRSFWFFKDSMTGIIRFPRKQAIELAHQLASKAVTFPVQPPLSDEEQDASSRKSYTCWMVTGDMSIKHLKNGHKTRTLASKHGNAMRARKGADDWESSGIEFISPIYTQEQLPKALADVHELATAMDTGLSCMATNESCGFHVHIGRPDQTAHPIEALRVVAFITIIFEDLISLLHPQHRQGEERLIRSNRIGIVEADTSVLWYEDNPEAQTQKLQSRYPSVAELRRKIFKEVPVDAAHDYLAFIMGNDKHHLINWMHCGQKTDPDEKLRTIEFRQHDATFDPAIIGHWVRFCLALTSSGYRWASLGANSLPKVQKWSDCSDIRDLLDWMQLPGDTRQHFQDRYNAAIKDGRDLAIRLWQMKISDEEKGEKSEKGVAKGDERQTEEGDGAESEEGNEEASEE